MNDKTIVKAVKNYRGARSTLGLLVLLTVVNIVMYAIGNTGESVTYFLFSAIVPYMLAVTGIDTGGVALGVTAGIAFITWFVYLLAWLGSRKKRGWLTAALIFFIIDTIALFVFFLNVEFIIDIIAHIVILIYLIMGISGGKKLAKAGLALVNSGAEAPASAVEAVAAAPIAAAPVAAAAAVETEDAE